MNGLARAVPRRSSARPLDGEERVLVGGVADLGAADLALLHPGVRRLAVARVDDNEVVVGPDPVGDQVVDDPAAVVREQGVLRLAVADLVEIVREQGLQQLVRVRPSTWNWPICETSKTPASVRTALCSGITPSYCTGISQPANGTSRAPAAT